MLLMEIPNKLPLKETILIYSSRLFLPVFLRTNPYAFFNFMQAQQMVIVNRLTGDS